MITFLHGDNIEVSRAEFNRIKAATKGKEIRSLDGRTLDAAALTQAVESTSLFGGDTMIFIENLFGKLGRKTKLIESLAAILTKSADTVDIVLWEDKEMGVTVIKSLGKADVKLFKIPSIIFQFLDTLNLPATGANGGAGTRIFHADAPYSPAYSTSGRISSGRHAGVAGEPFDTAGKVIYDG